MGNNNVSAAGKPAVVSTTNIDEYVYHLRQTLFPETHSEDALRALLKDKEPALVFSDDNGFKVLIGNYRHAEDLPGLEERGITHIVNMAAAEAMCKMTPEVYGDGYTCLLIRANDLENYDLSVHFEEVWQFIEHAREQKTGVLVHCVAGVSRSVTVVIGYLMKIHGMTLSDAARLVHTHRRQAYPNSTFIKCLIKLDKELQHSK